MPMSRNNSRNESTKSDNKKNEKEELFNVQKLRIELKCKNESQKKFSNLIDKSTITICAGPAGTGKTYIACAKALKLLKMDTNYSKIILVKSVTELEGESIGYLKGDLKEKMYQYMLSFIDNFNKIIGEDLTTKMMDMGIIQVLPLTYIRGRSIDNAIIIVDESQNISLKNMRSTLTRIGENSKMIVMGDTKQIDLKDKRLSSLDKVISMFEEKDGFGTMSFQVKDIVRHPIVKMIEDEFDKLDEEDQNKKIK